MPVLTDYARNLVTRALCGRLPALPAQVFAALGNAGSALSGVTGEPAGGGYARQRVTFTGNGLQSNNPAIVFTFTAAAGPLTHVGLFDAPTGGNALTYAPLPAPVTIPATGSVTINLGDLDIDAS